MITANDCVKRKFSRGHFSALLLTTPISFRNALSRCMKQLRHRGSNGARIHICSCVSIAIPLSTIVCQGQLGTCTGRKCSMGPSRARGVSVLDTGTRTLHTYVAATARNRSTTSTLLSAQSSKLFRNDVIATAGCTRVLHGSVTNYTHSLVVSTRCMSRRKLDTVSSRLLQLTSEGTLVRICIHLPTATTITAEAQVRQGVGQLHTVKHVIQAIRSYSSFTVVSSKLV